jgi:hypothetical protein
MIKQKTWPLNVTKRSIKRRVGILVPCIEAGDIISNHFLALLDPCGRRLPFALALLVLERAVAAG